MIRWRDTDCISAMPALLKHLSKIHYLTEADDVNHISDAQEKKTANHICYKSHCSTDATYIVSFNETDPKRKINKLNKICKFLNWIKWKQWRYLQNFLSSIFLHLIKGAPKNTSFSFSIHPHNNLSVLLSLLQAPALSVSTDATMTFGHCKEPWWCC